MCNIDRLIFEACGAHNENEEHLLTTACVLEFGSGFQRLPLHDTLSNTDQYKVEKCTSGCLAARDSILAEAARA